MGPIFCRNLAQVSAEIWPNFPYENCIQCGLCRKLRAELCIYRVLQYKNIAKYRNFRQNYAKTIKYASSFSPISAEFDTAIFLPGMIKSALFFYEAHSQEIYIFKKFKKLHRNLVKNLIP